MTPSDIELLLFCYYSPEVHPRIDAPAIVKGIEMLLKHNLICPSETPCVYNATERGSAHVKQMCSLHFPYTAWLDQHNNIIQVK
jgi:hypothetical protein